MRVSHCNFGCIACRSSGPQGSIKPLTIIDDPAAWTAESLKGKESEYTYTLTKDAVGEIITAVQKIKARIPHTEEGVLSVRNIRQLTRCNACQ